MYAVEILGINPQANVASSSGPAITGTILGFQLFLPGVAPRICRRLGPSQNVPRPRKAVHNVHAIKPINLASRRLALRCRGFIVGLKHEIPFQRLSKAFREAATVFVATRNSLLRNRMISFGCHQIVLCSLAVVLLHPFCKIKHFRKPESCFRFPDFARRPQIRTAVLSVPRLKASMPTCQPSRNCSTRATASSLGISSGILVANDI